MKTIVFAISATAALAIIALTTTFSQADFTTTGNVEPADPATWTTSTRGYIGNTTDGTLRIDLGSELLSYSGHLGYNPGATGEVTVDGAGSTWTTYLFIQVGLSGNGILNITDGGAVINRNSTIGGSDSASTGTVTVDGAGSIWTNDSHLFVGRNGDGTLNITNGGEVSVNEETWVGHDGGSGLIDFGTNGGTLTTGTLVAGTLQLNGAGAINTRGLISNVDLVFDATHGLNRTFTLNDPGQNISLNLDMSGISGLPGDLGVGYQGNGTLAIRDGVAISSQSGYLGYTSGSTAAATVDGGGSTWTNSSSLCVGLSGTGTLDITGGAVSNISGYIGKDSGSTGVVTVDGAGSTWSNSERLYVGDVGNGTLNITDGGTVSNISHSYIGLNSGSTSLVTVDGAGSAWASGGEIYVGHRGNGTLNITNSGEVSVDATTWVGYHNGSSGLIDFGTNGGTLTTGGLVAGSSQLKGTGTINARSLVSDVDLVFNATHGLSQTFILNDPGQNITFNLDMSGTSGTPVDFGVGYQGNGTLAIRDGVTVSSRNGYLGYKSGSTAVATVDGAGSAWTNSDDLYIGRSGNATLEITGGAVSNNTGLIGHESGSTGVATVDGTGTTWTNSKLLFVGNYGNGTLNITDGGVVSAGSSTFGIVHSSIGYNSGSTGAVIVDGAGSAWNNGNELYVGNEGDGTLSITDGGTVNNTCGNIGYGSGSRGTVNVDGAGSTWTNSGNLYVGCSGDGTLNITSGAVSNSTGYISTGPDSTGTVTVDGSGSTWTNSGYFYVGNTGNGTLNITGGGAVSNTYGSIGNSPGSTGVVTVDGMGSTWTNSGYLNVGDSGDGTLNITNGGVVSVSKITWVGYYSGSSGLIDFGTNGGTLTTGGLVTGTSDLKGTGTINARSLVSDVDLVFDATHGLSQTFTLNEPGQNITFNLDMSDNSGTPVDFGVGYQGNGTLVIRDSVAISSWRGYLGYKNGSTAMATVDGVGSAWTNSGDLYVGRSGKATLNITDGGAVSNRNGFIGHESGSTGAVTVNGVGSTWTNSDELYVGNEGDGTLIITSGGAVDNSNGKINSNSASTVDGVGSTWTNSGELYVGGTLSISDGGVVSNSNEGCIDVVSSLTDALGTVDGAGSTWTNGDELYIGRLGVGTLNINDGGAVSNADESYIGYYSSSTGTVTVDGAASTWTSSESIHVGYRGNGTLNITGGGTVINFYKGYIGYNSNSTGAVTVDGAGSTWTCDSDLYVGHSGNATLDITGGAVSNISGYIGGDYGSAGAVTVDGVDSIWTNSEFLYVGCQGNGALNITDGGTVSNAYHGFIGRYSGSTGVATVDGAGSTWTWTNSYHLYVGDEGDGTLNITNGGAVSVNDTTWVGRGGGSGIIDFGPNGGMLTTGTLAAVFLQLKGTGTINTRGLVSDVDLVFDATHGLSQTLNLNDPGQNIALNLDLSGTNGTPGDLGAGYQGNGALTIRDGVTVSSRDGYLGYKSGSIGTATVDGTGSTWTNSAGYLDGRLYVGYYGDGTLSIAAGGEVNDRSGYIGLSSESTGAVTVDGSGSTWTNDYDLFVGRSGDGTLNITEGGAVSNANKGYIGYYSGSTGAVTVDGSGSTWTNSGYIFVGGSGNGTLNITDGGVVSNANNGYIGYDSGSMGAVTVDGAGSTWTNSAHFYIGCFGDGTLHITNGGVVSNNARGDIGYNSSSIGEVTVDGAGSTWKNGGDLYVGNEGDGTLNISNNGLVSVGEVLTIDYDNDGNGFVNMKNGGMLALAGDADGSIDDFLGLIGGSDALRYWNESTSLWESIAGAKKGSDYTLEYLTEGDLAGYTLLTVLAGDSLPGDANFDGLVDVCDLGILATNYGSTRRMNWATGDFNSDRAVDVCDLGILASNYGAVETTVNTAVPEPTALSLLLSAIAGMLCICRRRCGI